MKYILGKRFFAEFGGEKEDGDLPWAIYDNHLNPVFFTDAKDSASALVKWFDENVDEVYWLDRETMESNIPADPRP